MSAQLRDPDLGFKTVGTRPFRPDGVDKVTDARVTARMCPPPAC